MTRQRPSGIVLVAIWFFFAGLFNATSGAAVAFFVADVFRLLGVASSLSGGPGFESVQLLYTLLGVVLTVTGVGMFILGWGLLEGREWARTWGVAAAGVSALGKLALAALPLVLLGGFAAGALLILVTPALLDLLALVYLLSEEARTYCSGYAPAPGPWPPIQETVSAPQPQTPPPPPVLSRTELVAPPVPAVAWLVPRAPGRIGRQFPLQAGRNTIGRDGSRCEVTLDDSTVSSEHAAVVFEHGRFVLYDLASTNGTYLNGQRIQRQMLYDNDEVRLGNSVLVFKKV
jgi:hypothetical protein